MVELKDWENFYVIVGSSAGALIGLQFVAMTLIAERRLKAAAEANPVFATPTIAHFSVVLLLSAILSIPWALAQTPVLLSSLIGLIGAIYTLVIAWKMRRQSAYQPDMEDLTFHVGTPLLGYGLLASSSLLHLGFFAIAGAALVLLFTGIHNSWDSVLFVSQSPPADESSKDEAS